MIIINKFKLIKKRYRLLDCSKLFSILYIVGVRPGKVTVQYLARLHFFFTI